jgi:hypothetical protein
MTTPSTRSGLVRRTIELASLSTTSSVPGPDAAPPPFDGFPYLVTRIGRTSLRHLAVLPADWPRDRLVELALRQADANRLETCAVFGPADAVYASPGGAPQANPSIPTGTPVIDRLVIAGPIADSPEQRVRRVALAAYAARHAVDGYVVGDGLESGRHAIPADIARLSGRGTAGLPRGLRRCGACGEACGEFLALRGEGNLDLTPRVLDVHCRCDNHNRCAGCGEALADRRLSAYYWDEVRAGAWYVAAYCGLGHRCASG